MNLQPFFIFFLCYIKNIYYICNINKTIIKSPAQGGKVCEKIMKNFDYNSVGVKRDYVENLLHSKEFKRYVLKEGDEDVYDEKCVSIEEKGNVITYKYINEYGDLCFKEVFYVM